jgi:hypothetical protein
MAARMAVVKGKRPHHFREHLLAGKQLLQRR